jgi:hypothetical protein
LATKPTSAFASTATLPKSRQSIRRLAPCCTGGLSGFAEEFVRRSPHDGQGRSLRKLDLKRRRFKYPCSPLIYSAAFEGLPAPVKDHVLRRLWEVLRSQDTSGDFAHQSAADPEVILGILRATKAALPEYWRRSR